MDLDLSIGTLAGWKTDAKAFRQAQSERGEAVSHAHALEHVAHANGARDWNTLSAQAKRPVRLAPGQRVAGRYLNQPFTGAVHSLTLMDGGNKLRVSLQFDAPVDVVTFDSFSSLRSRVSAVIGAQGRSVKHTSDGQPHLVIDRILS